MTNHRSNWHARRRVKPTTAGRQIGTTGLYVQGPAVQNNLPKSRSAQKKAEGRYRTTTQRKRAVAQRKAATTEVARNIDGSPVISVGTEAVPQSKVTFTTPIPINDVTIQFGHFKSGQYVVGGTEAFPSAGTKNTPKPINSSSDQNEKGFTRVVSKSTRKRGNVPKTEKNKGKGPSGPKKGKLPLILKEDLPPSGVGNKKSARAKEAAATKSLKAAWVIKGSCKVAPADPIFETKTLYSRFVPTMSKSVEFVTEDEGERTFGYWRQTESSRWGKRIAWVEGRRFELECDEAGDVFVNGVWRILSALNYGAKIPYGVLKDLGWHIYADDNKHVTLKHRGKLGTYKRECERVALTIFAQNAGFLTDEVKTLAPSVGEGFCYIHWFWEAAFLHNYNLSLESIRRKLGKFPHMVDVVTLFLKIFPFLRHWGFRCEKVEGVKGLLHADLSGPNHIMIDSYGSYRVGGRKFSEIKDGGIKSPAVTVISERGALKRKLRQKMRKSKRRSLRKALEKISPPGEGKWRVQKLMKKDYLKQGLPLPKVDEGGCFFGVLDNLLRRGHRASKRSLYAGLSDDYHSLRRQATLRYNLGQLGVSNVISALRLKEVLLSIDRSFDLEDVHLTWQNSVTYHIVPSGKLWDLTLTQLLRSDPDGLIGMDYSTFDLELSRVMADTTDKVKNMQVKDSVALRAVEGAVLADFNYSKSLYDSKPIVVVPYKVEETLQRLIVAQFPELRLKFTHSILNAHAVAAISRLCYNHLLKYRFSDLDIIDIGGDIRFHIQNSLNGVHICNPILDVKDASRYTSRNIDWERTYSRDVMKAIGGKQNVSFCYKNALDCDHKASVAIAVEVYDISLDDVATIMLKREIDVCHFVLVCPGELLDTMKNDIPVPDLGIVIRHGDDGASLDYYMPEGLGYSHNKDKILSFFKHPVFLKGGQLFHCELLGTRLSINEFRITRNKSFSSGQFRIPISVPRATANLIAIRIPDWKKRGSFLNKNFSQEIMVDKVFFIRAIQYVMGITSSVNDKTFEYVTTWLRNNSARIVISGKVIHQDVHIDTRYLEKVAAILLVIGAKKKTLGTRYARKLNVSTGGDLSASALLREKIQDAYGDFMDKMQVLGKYLFPFLGLVGDLDVDSLYRECEKTTNLETTVLIKENGEPVSKSFEIEKIEEHVKKSLGVVLENQVKKEADHGVFVPSVKLRGSATRGDPGCGLKAGSKGDSFFLNVVKNWVEKCALQGVRLFFKFLDLLDNLKEKFSNKLMRGIGLVKSVLTFFTPDSSWGDAVSLGISEIVYQSVIFLWDLSSGKGIIKSFFSLLTRIITVFSTHNFFFKNADGSTDVFLQSAVVSTLITTFERKIIGDENTYVGGVLKALIATGILRGSIRYYLTLWFNDQDSSFGPYVLSNLDVVENYQVLVTILKRSLLKLQSLLEVQVANVLAIATDFLGKETSVGRGVERITQIQSGITERLQRVREWLGFKRSFAQAIPSTEFITQSFDVAENDEDFHTVRESSDAEFEENFSEVFGINPDGSVQGGGNSYKTFFYHCNRTLRRLLKWTKSGIIGMCHATLEIWALIRKYSWRLVVDVITVWKLDHLFRKISTEIIESCDLVLNLGRRTLATLDKFFPGSMTFAMYVDLMLGDLNLTIAKKTLLVHEVLTLLATNVSFTTKALRKVVFTLYLKALPPNLALFEYDRSSPYQIRDMPVRVLLTRTDGEILLPFGGPGTFTPSVFSRVQGRFRRRMTGGRPLNNTLLNPFSTMKALYEVLHANLQFLFGDIASVLSPLIVRLREFRTWVYRLYFDKFVGIDNDTDEGSITTLVIDTNILGDAFLEARLAAEIRLTYLQSVEREVNQNLSDNDLVLGNGGSQFTTFLSLPFFDWIRRGLRLTTNLIRFFFYGTLVCTYEGGITSEVLNVGLLVLKGLCFGFSWMDLLMVCFTLRDHFPWTWEEIKHKIQRFYYVAKACPVVDDVRAVGINFPRETYDDVLARISQGLLSLRSATSNFRKRREKKVHEDVLVEKYRRELLIEDPDDIISTDTDLSSTTETVSGTVSTDSELEKDDLLVGTETSEFSGCPDEDVERDNFNSETSKSVSKDQKRNKKNKGRKGRKQNKRAVEEKTDMVAADRTPIPARKITLGDTTDLPELRSGRSFGDFIKEKVSASRDDSIYRSDINKLNFELTTYKSVEVPQHGSVFQKAINSSCGAIIPPPDYSKLNPLSWDINEYIYNRVLELCNVLRTVQGVWASLKNSNFQHELVIESLDPHVSLYHLGDGKVINKGNVKADDLNFAFCFDGNSIRPFLGSKEGLKITEPFLVLHEDLRVFYSELFLRRFKSIDFVDYDLSCNKKFFAVESPPGGGKTTELIATFVEFFAKGLEVRIVTANRNSREEIVTKVLALLVHRGICEIKTDVKVMMSDRIRTADSYCMNVAEVKPVDVLFIDELFMIHAGQTLFLTHLLKAAYTIGYGDSNQIGFINRIDLQVANYFNINDIILDECRSYRSLSYRCPADVCRELSEVYGRKISPACNSREDTMEIRPIRCLDDFEFEDGVKYITFTQGEKFEINKVLGKSKVKCEDAQTIHEVQGNTYQHVRLVRIKPQDDPVFASQTHITVALSRHVESLRYFVINVKLNDATCERINHSKELSRLAREVADSTPYIEAIEDDEYLEVVDDKPQEGRGPPGSSTVSAFQDFLEEVIPGTTLTSLGNLSAELSTNEFKSVVDRIKIKANTFIGKKPLEPRSQRV
nr:ORF1a polyprotein [Olive leaf yellowing-associated virus]